MSKLRFQSLLTSEFYFYFIKEQRLRGLGSLALTDLFVVVGQLVFGMRSRYMIVVLVSDCVAACFGAVLHIVHYGVAVLSGRLADLRRVSVGTQRG